MYTAGTARTNAYFGSGTGHIYMKDVTCITSKTSLLQCTSDPLLSGGCSHSQDAGVECEGKTVIFMPNRPVHDIHYDNRMASSKEFVSVSFSLYCTI